MNIAKELLPVCSLSIAQQFTRQLSTYTPQRKVKFSTTNCSVQHCRHMIQELFLVWTKSRSASIGRHRYTSHSEVTEREEVMSYHSWIVLRLKLWAGSKTLQCLWLLKVNGQNCNFQFSLWKQKNHPSRPASLL